jgi:hypothetical protein
MRWNGICKHPDWKRYFAWYPVTLITGQKAWLEYVWKRCHNTQRDYFGHDFCSLFGCCFEYKAEQILKKD